MSSYKTIEGRAESEIVEKKSRFIAHLSHVDSEQDALEFLSEIKKEHIQARHNVYAYILKSGKTRYSDDGEPAQTSGLPTFETLEHAGLLDVACVTTRYFGGVLLGTGGLVRAYTQAARSAIEVAHVVVVSLCIDVSFRVPYSLYAPIERLALDKTYKVMSTDFSQEVSMVLRCLAPERDALVKQLTEITRGQVELAVSDPHEAVF